MTRDKRKNVQGLKSKFKTDAQTRKYSKKDSEYLYRRGVRLTQRVN